MYENACQRSGARPLTSRGSLLTSQAIGVLSGADSSEDLRACGATDIVGNITDMPLAD